MIQDADAVVIGSGALGASVAFHLVRTGVSNVALLDRFEIASQTSPRAAGLTQQIRPEAMMTRLAMLSVQKIVRFTEETGEPMVYYQSGSVKMARTEADEGQIRVEIAAGRTLGLDIHEIGPSDLERLTPFAKPVGVRAMWYTPSDLYLEPVQIPLGYARGADVAAPAVRDSMLSVVSAHWGLGSRLLADVFLPEASAHELETFARFQREAAAAETAAAHLGFVYSVDVAAELAQIDTPTLVLHRREDRAIPFELGRELTASVAGARLVTLEGSQHLPWRGDAAAVASAMGEFLDGDAGAGRLLRTRRPEAAGGEPPGLSERELEVLRLVAAGLSDAEIADRLVLSPHTVHRHVANVRTKLRQPSRAAAVAQAGRLGLI